MTLGRCVNLELAEPTILLSYGATASWTPSGESAATWEVHGTASTECGGEQFYSYATLHLLCRGCGRIKVTVAGVGATDGGGTLVEALILLPDGTSSAQGVLMQTTGSGGDDPCGSTEISGDKTWKVACGAQLVLIFETSALNVPETDCTFNVEVLP